MWKDLSKTGRKLPHYIWEAIRANAAGDLTCKMCEPLQLQLMKTNGNCESVLSPFSVYFSAITYTILLYIWKNWPTGQGMGSHICFESKVEKMLAVLGGKYF
jgi:hypothetical protein